MVAAGATRVSFRSFLLTIIAGRSVRFVGLAYLGTKLGENSIGWLGAHALQLSLVAAGLFLFLFGLVKWADYRKRRMAPEAAAAGK